MDFNHTEDRRMLADSLRRYLADQYSMEIRNETAYEPPFHNTKTWQEISELGILSALVSPEKGGFGGEGFDISVVFEELGRALCAEPLLATLMGLNLLSRYDQQALTNEVIAGTRKVALAVHEPGSANSLINLSTEATKDGDAWLVSGTKSVVYGAPTADLFLVFANHGNQTWFVLNRASEVTAYAMIDGGGAGEVTFNSAAATCLCEDALEDVEAALDIGRLALCAEAVGAMDILLGMTVEYLKQRQQFGTVIATFQALQHRVVDMAVEIEQCRSITTLAASKLDSDERARYIAMAKNLIGRGATLVGGGSDATPWRDWHDLGIRRVSLRKASGMIDHQLGDRYEQLANMAG